MTLPVPLNVRLSSGRMDRHITRELRDLTFRSTDPGGFSAATFSFDRDIRFQPHEVAYFARVYIYDGRNGSVVWEGRLEDPGRSANADGRIWSMTAMGPAVHALDDFRPLIYIDREIGDRWKRSSFTNKKAAQVQTSDQADEEPSFELVFTEGSTVDSNVPHCVAILYRSIFDAGLGLGRVRVLVKNNTSSANFQNRITTHATPSDTGTTRDSSSFSTSEQILSCGVGGTNPIALGDDVAELRVQVQAGGELTLPSDRVAEFYGIVVRQILVDAEGDNITGDGAYGVNYVLASEVVTDLIGRCLPQYDGSGVAIATTNYQIQHLVYPDGTRPAQVLDDLLIFEPGFTWAAWESDPATDLYRFEWKVRPEVARYEAGVLGGFDSPGAASALYNRAVVRYKDWRGRERTIVVTQDVRELTEAGVTRTLDIDLGDIASSAANATRAGEQQLAEHATPPNAGQLIIDRPIHDLNTGRFVMPWEIRPGELIRVNGIVANVDALNATTRDGVTVFRIKSVEFNAASAAATLELDSYSHATQRAVATANKRARARRR